MRTAKDVIDKWTHDPRCDVGACVVGYLDRILQKILEKPLTAFSSWGSIEQASRDDLAIPQHRVVYFKFRGRVVWDKRSRLDEVFGSTPPFVRVPLGGEEEEAPDEAARGEEDDAHTPLQRYLRRAGLAAFEDVERRLRNPPFRCKVRPACLGGTEVYLVMYDDQLQFGSQKETERTPAALALDHCRGAIYEQNTNKLLCCAFDKFWEVGDRRAADVDLDDPRLEVAEKCDGLLVKVFHCGGAWRVASNGCVDAKRAAFRWGDDGAATTVGALFDDAVPPDLRHGRGRGGCGVGALGGLGRRPARRRPKAARGGGRVPLRGHLPHRELATDARARPPAGPRRRQGPPRDDRLQAVGRRHRRRRGERRRRRQAPLRPVEERRRGAGRRVRGRGLVGVPGRRLDRARHDLARRRRAGGAVARPRTAVRRRPRARGRRRLPFGGRARRDERPRAARSNKSPEADAALGR